MLKRRAPPHTVLSAETRRKFAALASVFVNVDKRNVKKSKRKKDESYSAKATKDKKTKLNYKDIGPWACGPVTIFRCLKEGLTIDIAFDIMH